jgi:hypothetical protein
MRATALSVLARRPKALGADERRFVAAIARDDEHGDVKLRAAATDLLAAAGAPEGELYALFATKTWVVRFHAAKALLERKDTDLDAWMKHLPVDEKAPMGAVEPLAYGTMITAARGEGALKPWLGARALGPKLVAIGAFYNAPVERRAELQKLADDPTKLPSCAADRACVWRCGDFGIHGIHGPSPDATTIGELVKVCIEPSLGHKNSLPSSEAEALRSQPVDASVPKDAPVSVVALGPDLPTAPIDDLDGVMRLAVLPRARVCHKRALVSTPTASGRLTLKLEIDGKGEVTSASTDGPGMPPVLGACLASSSRGMLFRPPKNGKVTISVPLIFSVQK